MQSSGQVGSALILAVVTALVSAAAGFGQFRPGFDLIAGVAVAGLLLNLIPLVSLRLAGRR